MFIIDGLQWDLPCKIQRTAEIKPSEISGMMLNKQYFADIIGTYLSYNVSIALPFGDEDTYSRLYEKLTEPVDGHTIIAPYNQGTVTITGRIDKVQDTHLKRRIGSNYWMEITFNFIASNPTKEMDLDEVLSRGFAPLPEGTTISIGTSYTYTANGWVPIMDGDDEYY